MRRVMVIGAGGGIGLALVDALAARADVEQVCAVHRRPVSSISGNVSWLEAALDDRETICCAARTMIEQGGLDGIFVATGLLHDASMRPEKSLRELSENNLANAFLVNAAQPLLLIAALKPLLKRAQVPFACLLSAQVGSIADNRLGGWYGYRMAKAALNMGIRTAAIELAREHIPTRLLAVHPGTTRSGLSAPFIRRRRDPVATPEETAACLLDTLEGSEAIESGSFIRCDGTPLPW